MSWHRRIGTAITWGPIARLLVLLGLTALVLAACGPTSDGPARLDNYLARLERALDTPVGEPPFLRPPRISEAHLTALPSTATAISVLDFLALSGCELQINLGRRNSSLGRNASASQRLILDLEFLTLAPPCIAYLKDEGKTELAQRIADIARERVQLIPIRVYNSLLAGPEFQALWSLPAQLGDYPAQTSGDVIDALQAIEQSMAGWLTGDYRIDGQRFEEQLSVLRAGDGGALLLAAAVQSRGLAQASALLASRGPGNPLCPGGRRSDSADITQTVVSKFFAGDVQPWLAQLSRRQGQLLSPIERIEHRLKDILPPRYRDWRRERDALLNTLRDAPRHHVQAIKTAFEACHDVGWGQ